jgi:hypothetical protein
MADARIGLIRRPTWIGLFAGCVIALLSTMLWAGHAQKPEGTTGKFVSFDDHTMVLSMDSGGSATAGARQSFDIPAGITVHIKKAHGNEKGLTPGALHALPKGVKISLTMDAEGKVSEITVDHPNFKKRLTPTQVP